MILYGTCFGPGCGMSTSVTWQTSGPPKAATLIALIPLSSTPLSRINPSSKQQFRSLVWITRLTPRTVTQSYYPWYKYMYRQSACSTRLAPQTVSLSYYPWYEYMDWQSVSSTRLTLRTVSLSYYHLYKYGSAISLQYKADPMSSHHELVPLLWMEGNQPLEQGCRTDSGQIYFSFSLSVQHYHWYVLFILCPARTLMVSNSTELLIDRVTGLRSDCCECEWLWVTSGWQVGDKWHEDWNDLACCDF